MAGLKFVYARLGGLRIVRSQSEKEIKLRNGYSDDHPRGSRNKKLGKD
jgi:hypothetical protein